VNHIKDLPPELRARLVRCKEEVWDVGLVLRGSVTQRWTSCGKSGCRCQAEPPRLHGPYYQWTTKVSGKTKTLRLRADEVDTFRAWIAEGRRLDGLVASWKELSFEAVQQIREISRR